MVGRCQLCQNKAKRVVLVYKWRSVAYNVGKNMIKTGDQQKGTLGMDVAMNIGTLIKVN
jgi:hypothetical protein